MSEIAEVALIEICGSNDFVRLEPARFLETLRFSHAEIELSLFNI